MNLTELTYWGLKGFLVFAPGTPQEDYALAGAQNTQIVEFVYNAQEVRAAEGVTVGSTVQFIQEHYDSLFRRLAD